MRVLVEAEIFVEESPGDWQGIIDWSCPNKQVCFEQYAGKEMRCENFEKQPTGVKVCNR